MISAVWSVTWMNERVGSHMLDYLRGTHAQWEHPAVGYLRLVFSHRNQGFFA